MGKTKVIASKYGFAVILFILGIFFVWMAVLSGQNNYVYIGLSAVVACAVILALNNAGIIPLNMMFVFLVLILVSSLGFTWLDYYSIQEKLDFFKEQNRRKAKVVERLIDIRTAEMSYKKLYGNYTASFDELIRHVKYDSLPVVKAIGFVPDTLTEVKAVELGIVTRDTLLISLRDTLFPKNYPLDSLQYVPFSSGARFVLHAGEIEKNKMKVKVFEAFADYGKILHGIDLSEEYIDVKDGLRVGSMTDPHTRGNWE